MNRAETFHASEWPIGPDLAHILDTAGIAVLGVDPVCVIAFANAPALSLLRLGRRSLIGMPLDRVFGDDSDITDAVHRILRQDVAIAELECPLIAGGVSLGAVSMMAQHRPDDGGVTVTLLPRSRRRSGERPTQAPPIARTLAHEVRNPLAGIRGAAQLIGKDANADTRALVDLICAEVDRIRRLTDRLDDFDTTAPPQRGPLNIHAVLDRVTQILRPSAGDVSIMTDYDPSLPQLLGDGDQLIQAVLNLAKNAVEACPRDGGRVVLATRYRSGSRLREIKGGAVRALLEVSITDNGPGVAAHIVDRLFEPFATTKANGVGLGLAVASKIIAAHGGRIDLDSVPGATVFRICLPLEHTL
jgi:two-component system nitrogen regulation sensor histidine kinase GlnL